ncbi:D-alanyl-D-alanine carboxypeptidase [Mycolicibacterium madagascariense]|uniref:D-alanyl-D-alanine carboxypeptidase n=1 Tax=Mycolicibacterium madagascariense TaxID=212765 RepID=A0A7I7XDP8_9MYCO|nr:M15 family metallopeptidase [Mycolicibacterium madagascariense]MCV7015336.1 M15 family metallopeptidase [Mycolicibacterium madagascariense]BBZ27632.1 D-alanyl-D-alanine carboxypeptidase [Mycolicibacterium madagascariense]
MRSAVTVAAAAAVLALASGLTPLTAAPVALADQTTAVGPPADPGDGSLPNGGTLSPFDVGDPAIGRLDPQLRSAIQDAATAARADGVTMTITSGWRSAEFQQRLLDDAVHTYGSLAVAREYVETPEHSKHVIGEAVDVGGTGADQWLIAHGARFGLCQIYANELWHFELATDAAGACPPLRPNAA